MLKLTKKLEYALIALRHMQSKGTRLSSSKEIADKYVIPKELLAKTLQKMARLQYIEAVQGPYGGYRLKKRSGKISLTQFFEEIEGPIGMADCIIDIDCIQSDRCNIRQPINDINNNIRSIFNNITLGQITK